MASADIYFEADGQRSAKPDGAGIRFLLGSLALQNLGRRKARTFLLLAAVAICSGAVFTGAVLMRSIENSMDLGFTRLGADMLGQVGQERDRLVMHLALDLADALDLEFAALAQCLCGSGGDDSELLLRLAGVGLDIELDAEIVLRLPDRRHLRPAVARDHAETSSAGISSVSTAESAMRGSAISTSSWYWP